MSPKIIYPLFFLSGVAGLIYEIIWSRQLVLIFGSTTNSIVAVISSFLGGLAIGSLLFGKLADKLSAKKLIKTYSNLEFAVALTAALTLFFIPQIKQIYSLFSDGSTVSLNLLITKFALAILVLVIPAIFMGATLPILVRFCHMQSKSLGNSVSLLYALNTFGAVLGVLISAFILIESFGLKNTLLIAVAINLFVAALSRVIKVKEKESNTPNSTTNFSPLLNFPTILAIFAFATSGLVSIAYEVLWTRILTPTVGTFIYAFATILAIYLFGIALGSTIYSKFSQVLKDKNLAFGFCQLTIGFFALGSIYLTSNQIALSKETTVILVLLPATIFMGLTFPAIVAILSSGGNSGKLVGLSYFANTTGSIIGGFLASFMLLPYVGSSQSVILLAIVNFILATIFIVREKKITVFKNLGLFAVVSLLIFTSWLFIFKRHSLYQTTTQWRINWAKESGIDYFFKEDEVASVFGYHNKKNNDQNLFIDGVPTTGRVIETRLMAHIPILLHNNPQDILIIAFGMGATFRSSLTYGLKTDVVELAPSVPKMITLFHKDGVEVLSDPNGEIIINDGRNYVFLTRKKYDIVTIDPPPPFNAAGTTVLYSKEFYREISKKLKPRGIVSQWIWFGSREDDIAMAIKSFVEVFPYVLVFSNPAGEGGIYLEGSFNPIVIDKKKLAQKLSLAKPKEDLAEISSDIKLEDILGLYIGNQKTLSNVVSTYPPVTDDKPITEYFFLRHHFTSAPDLTTEKRSEFIQKLKDGSSLTFK